MIPRVDVAVGYQNDREQIQKTSRVFWSLVFGQQIGAHTETRCLITKKIWT